MENDGIYYECTNGKVLIVPKFYIEWKQKNNWTANYNVWLNWLRQGYVEGTVNDHTLMEEIGMPRESIDKLVGPLFYRQWRRSPYAKRWSYNELVRKIHIAYTRNPHLTDSIMCNLTGIPIHHLVAIRQSAKFYDLPPRTYYDDEFKSMILRELNSGKTIASVCFEYELSPNTIAFWKKAKNERAS